MLEFSESSIIPNVNEIISYLIENQSVHNVIKTEIIVLGNDPDLQ